LNDVPLWNPTTNQWEPGQIPEPGSSASVVVQATSGNNVFQVDAGPNVFQPVTGADFAVVQAGTGWVLTASACVLTYGGALTCNFAIAVNGDLVGAAPAFQESVLFWSPIDGVNTLHTQRVVTLAPGLTIQPVSNAANPAVQTAISKLILSVIAL
jgi:hypothetical protein